MMISTRNESLHNKEGKRELKEFNHFKYFESMLTRDGYCKSEINMRIVIVKEAFNKKKYHS